MAKPTIYLRDGIYIPIKTLPMDVDDIREEYTQRMYDDKICRQCPYKADRHSHYCDECEYGGFKGAVCFVKDKVIDGKRYMRFPIGDRLNVEERMRIDFKDYRFEDLRTNVPFDYKIKFTGALRDYQLPMLNGFVKMKHGLIKAPPRTGKTVTSIAIAIKLGQRTVIIADQVDFLENFMEEVAAHTNLPRLEEKYGKKLYGFLKTKEDYDTFQIGFATYQSFISEKNGKKRLKWLQKNFGTVWTDEVHRAAATEYSKFLSKCRMKYKGGCTATVQRKDCLTKGHVVLMSDLTLKPIHEIDVGDFVMSYNESFDLFEPKPVVETHSVVSTKRLVEIHHEHGILRCTEDHEVWCENRNSYVKAIELTLDDIVKVI